MERHSGPVSMTHVLFVTCATNCVFRGKGRREGRGREEGKREGRKEGRGKKEEIERRKVGLKIEGREEARGEE